MILPQNLCGATYEDFKVYMSEAEIKGFEPEEEQDEDDDSSEVMKEVERFNQMAESYMNSLVEGGR